MVDLIDTGSAYLDELMIIEQQRTKPTLAPETAQPAAEPETSWAAYLGD